MSAPGRFDRARQLARDAIARTPATDLVGVVTFDDQAEMAARPSTDRVLAASTIDQAAPGFVRRDTAPRSHRPQALNAVAGRRATIVLITDLQDNGWDEGDRASVPEAASIEIADVGPPPANLAVTAVRALTDRIVATIHNTGRSRDVRAHLTIDGRLAGDATTSVGANQSADVTFAGAPHGDAAAVTVDDAEGPAADNVRYAVLQGSHRPSVLIVTGSGSAARDAFYVQHALATGQHGGGGYDVVVTSGAQVSTGPEGALKERAAVLVLSTRGLERRGREALGTFVRDGGGLLMAVGPDIDGEVAADVLGGTGSLQVTHIPDARTPMRTLAPVDARHPLFRPFTGSAATLTLVRFRDAARISGNDCQTLARFTTGDRALIECAAGEGRALILASDLDNRWNDFPLHASFVPFLHEAIRYLASTHAYPPTI